MTAEQEQPTPFFAEEANLSALHQLIKNLSNQEELSTNPNVVPHLVKILNWIITGPGEFDRLCSWNIQLIGKDFISAMRNFAPQSIENESILMSIFIQAYRFLLEVEFSTQSEPNFEFIRINDFVGNNLDSFPAFEKQQLVFANYLMPAHLVKRLIYHQNLSDVRAFTRAIQSAGDRKNDWDEYLEGKLSEVNKLKEQLGKYETEYNFVGLVHGFQKLTKDKSYDKKWTFRSLLFIGAVVFSPIVWEIYFAATHISEIDQHKDTLIYTLPALIGLEVLLVYFFRVVHSHFRSINAQLLQLELRTSLCQFIQSYAEYASKIKAQDKSSLEKFENLIFSGIILNEESLPSTFDGIEQLAKLIKSVKSS